MITVHMIGNAHIDPVWLWRWPAGVGEALATCRTACDILDEEPEAVFTRSDAWLYEQVEQLDPALFQRIRSHAADGRWAVVGGWYVQADCNLPLARSFRRHMEIGLRHARERLGVRVTVGYNVDSFGHSASLPALLAEAGYDSYVFMRPMAGEKELPAALFRWRSPGADGGEVVAWRLPAGYCTGAADLGEHVRAALGCAVPGIDHVMCFYGVGDHGGGPTRAQVAWIKANRDAAPGVRLAFSSPRAFFDAVKRHAAELPIVTGELQHHSIGSYTVVHDIKSGIRRAERALEAAESATAAFPAHAPSDAAASLEHAWKQVLFNEFHDVAGGTSLPEACEDACDQLAAARQAAEGVLYATLFRRVAELPPHPCQRVVVYNPLDEDVDGLVGFEPWIGGRPFRGWMADEGGRPVAHQVVPPAAVVNWMEGLLWPARIPARGLRVFTLQPEPAGATAGPADLAVRDESIGNASWTARAGAAPPSLLAAVGSGTGSISLGVEVLEDASDTWSHGLDRFRGPVAGSFHPTGFAVEERGPLRASLRVDGSFGRSTISVWVRLADGDPRLELECFVDWREHQRVARLAISLPHEVSGRRDGIQLGGLERAQDGAERPVVDWTVARLGGAGAAALPAAEARGLSVACPDCFALSGEGHELRFTLLRSPAFAWHDPAPLPRDRLVRWTDQGEHRFRFSIRQGIRPLEAAVDAHRIHCPPVCLDWTRGM